MYSRNGSTPAIRDKHPPRHSKINVLVTIQQVSCQPGNRLIQALQRLEQPSPRTVLAHDT
jgi:hypothetical protein